MPVKAPIPRANLALAVNGGMLNNGFTHPQLPNNHPFNFPQQRFSQYDPAKVPGGKFYVQHVRQFNHVFHSQLPASPIWGFDSMFPGPTFKSFYGQPLLVRIINQLPGGAAPGGFGDPRITTHLHNAHTGFESDGNPVDFYPPLQSTPVPVLFRDHHYAMFRAGLTPTTTDGDPRETLSTLWYHDHALDHTAENTYKGLVGYHLFFDELDKDDETATGTLRLPSGTFDVPLVFADKRFDDNGQLELDVLANIDGFIGDKFTVNGKIQPFFVVQRRKYRFRLLNAGPSRFYKFFLSKNNIDRQFKLIGNDESLLPAPLTVTNVLITPAERLDIVIDFSQFNTGDLVYLVNRLIMRPNGRGPASGDGIAGAGNPNTTLPPGQGDRVLQFRVAGLPPGGDPSQVPPRLRENVELPGTLAEMLANPNIPKRDFLFERRNGLWVINGLVFDNVPRALPKQVVGFGPNVLGEIWTLRNVDNGWAHPIHIHLEEFRILSRNGKPPPAYEGTKKDVVPIGQEQVKIFIRFRDFLGRYPIHCHNTVHEDHAMMARFDVVP